MTTISKSILAVSVVIGIVWTGQAHAKQESLTHMPVTGRTTQPIGHYEYCKKYRRDCNLRFSDTRPVKLDRARWHELDRVNTKANREVRPVTDYEYYNKEEYWTYPDGFGDCEDYALLKRHMLMEQGWPASSLLITVVRRPNGEGHAVLTVRTDRADFVLDNLRDEILPWNETKYLFLKRQSAAHSGKWEGIEDSRNVMVGSVGN